jgi:hypothetical protein
VPSTTLEIFGLLKDAIAAIPLDAATAGDEPLFETVELAPNKNLGEQLQKLLVFKKRVCLIVPLRIVRGIRDDGGQLSILGTKLAEVTLIYSDKAYFKAEQAASFGTDSNLGLFATDEKIEAALCGKLVSPFGGIVPGDSDPITLSAAESAAAPGRAAWMMQLFIPIGLIESAVG